MARFRRGMSTRRARHVMAKASQKTKVKAIISSLSFAGNVRQDMTIATSSDVARANYFDNTVKPFSHIDVLHFDLAIYQTGATVSVDGFVDWAVWKQSGGVPAAANGVCSGAGLQYQPFIFKQGRAAVPLLTSNGMPSMYHLSGDIKIPPRLRLMQPGDNLFISFLATPAGAGISYSVNGVISYMFKI